MVACELNQSPLPFVFNGVRVTNIPYAKEIFREPNYRLVRSMEETERDQLCSKRDRRENGG